MFEDFRKRMSRYGTYQGERMRRQTETVMDATWMNSVSTYPVAVHSVMSGLPPEYECCEDYEDPLYAHFEIKNNYNAGGNEPSYYITFRPEDMREHTEIKVGSYVNIPGVNGDICYWLLIHQDNDNTLVRMQVLKCNWTLRWITNGVIYSSLCVLRSGSSESAGVEAEGQLSTVDSATYVWLPTNNDSVTISYDTRYLISDVGRVPPLAWSTNRISDIGPVGITRIRLAQDVYNATIDNATLMLANYCDSEITPIEPGDEPVCAASIVYNGTKPTLKVGGGFKIFTANGITPQSWYVNDGTNIFSVSTGDYIIDYTNRSMKLKVAQNYNLVGTVLTVGVVSADGVSADLKVEVIS